MIIILSKLLDEKVYWFVRFVAYFQRLAHQKNSGCDTCSPRPTKWC